MKSLFKTLAIISILAFNSLSVADIDASKPSACWINRLKTMTKEEMEARRVWFNENCLSSSNKSTSQTSNERNISDSRSVNS